MKEEKKRRFDAEKRYLYTYPPEDDISVMAARTPTAIIAKVNANSFSTIDIFAENALISKYRYWMFARSINKRVKLLRNKRKKGKIYQILLLLLAALPYNAREAHFHFLHNFPVLLFFSRPFALFVVVYAI